MVGEVYTGLIAPSFGGYVFPHINPVPALLSEASAENLQQLGPGVFLNLTARGSDENSLPQVILSKRPTCIRDLFCLGRTLRQAGITPIIVSDIDGTVYNARAKVRRLTYQFGDHYEGPGKRELQEVFHPFGQDSVSFWPQMIYHGSYLDLISPWDIEDAIRGVTPEFPGMSESARAFFDRHFFDLSNWRKNEVFERTVKLYGYAHNLGFRILFASLRGRDEDIADSGTSKTAEMLRAIGAMGDGDELVLKSGCSDRLNASDLVEGRCKEQNKMRNVLAHLQSGTALPLAVILAYFENDTKHLFEAEDTLGGAVTYVHVTGDPVPGSPATHPSSIVVNP